MVVRSFAGTDRPRRHPDSSYRAIGDEGGLVVLPGRAEVKVLNPVGVKVFGLLDGSRTLEEIAGEVVQEFEVGEEAALRDIREFLGELDAHQMLAD